MKQVIFFFLLFLLCLSQCVYFRMTHLSKDDLGWIQCYSHYPFPEFVSNTGETSTLSYEWVDIRNSTDRFYFSEGASYTYEANASYKFDLNHADTTKYGLIYHRFENGEEFKRVFKHKPNRNGDEAE